MKLFFNDISEAGFKDIQILKATTIYDKRYGEVIITEAMLNQMVANFDNKVRGIDLMLDAGHNTDKEAYGWFKSITVRMGEDGKAELWARVELTSLGQRALVEKHYGYISADFNTSYVDNETLKNHGVVLMGAALTNRPAVKGMKSAIELQEKKYMDLPELLQSLGVGSPEELVSMISDLRAKSSASETELAASKAAVMCAEKENKFNVMMTEGKVVEAQRKAFTDGDLEEFAKLAQNVKLTTVTTATEGDGEEIAADDKLIELANEKMQKEKIGFTKAMSLVLSENPELNKQYKTKMKGE